MKVSFSDLGFNENWSGDNTWFNFDENQTNFGIQLLDFSLTKNLKIRLSETKIFNDLNHNILISRVLRPAVVRNLIYESDDLARAFNEI